MRVDTGERVRYPIARAEWSVHYTISWDGKLFAGDGGSTNSVANHTPCRSAAGCTRRKTASGFTF